MDLLRFIELKNSKLNQSEFDGHTIPGKNSHNFPKKIYFYWDKGLDNAPEIVKECYKSWVSNNYGWEVINLSEDDANQILKYKKSNKLLSAHYADELRTKILYQDGGIWVDSTVYCSIPLDYWVGNILNQTEFFGFYRPGKDRIISNWFIASTAKSKLIKGWHDLYFKYINSYPINRPYFSHHWVFEYLLRTSPDHRIDFQYMPKISAEPVHLLQKVLLNKSFNSPLIERLRVVPLHKLSYKFPELINLKTLKHILKLIKN